MADFITRVVSFVRRRLHRAPVYVSSIWRKLTEDDVLFLASGLAFNGIFTLIPMLFLSAAAIGTIMNSYAVSMDQLEGILAAIFPSQPFAAEIRENLRSIIADIVVYRRSIGIFGFLVLLWTSTSLFDALRSALHRIYELKRTRGLLEGFAHDIGFMIVAFILFMSTNFAIWIYTLVTPWAMNIPAVRSFVSTEFTRTVPTMIIVLLSAVMFYIVYRHTTDVKPPKAVAMISTFTTTILWVISGRAFAVYIADWSIIGKIYGPYAFLLVLLIWIYSSSLIFVFGGIVGQVYWEQGRGDNVQELD